MDDITRFALKLERHIDRLEDEWRDDWAPKLADEMSRRAPRLTGRLANSMKPDGDGVTADTDYAIYVARGTSRMAPQPFDTLAVAAIIGDAAEGAGEQAIRELTR